MDFVPCDIRDLKPGTRILCGQQWHGVVLFNNTYGWYQEESDRAQADLGPGFMALYDEVGLVFQADADEIELDPTCDERQES